MEDRTFSIGATPVVAAALGIGIAIAGGATVYQVYLNTAGEATVDTPITANEIKFINCYENDTYLHVSARNIGEEPRDLSRLNGYMQAQQLGIEPSREFAEGGESFRINTTLNVSKRDETLTFVAGGQETSYDCEFTNLGPQANLTYSPPSPLTGSTVSFDASASRQGAAEIDTYEWKFNSSMSYQPGSNTETTFYTSPGTYTATVKVTDEQGMSSNASVTLTTSLPGAGLIEIGDDFLASGFNFTAIDNHSMLPPDPNSGGPTGTICLGSSCPVNSRTCTEYDTDDCVVDTTGDKMNGTLKTDNVSIDPSTDLCIGSGCPTATGSPLPPSNLISNSTYVMDGPFFVDAVRPVSGSLCVGVC